MKHEYIKRVFTDLHTLKITGIWFSGTAKEGEYIEWYENGQLYTHCFWKNKQPHGIFKSWFTNGEMDAYLKYENGKIVENLYKE